MPGKRRGVIVMTIFGIESVPSVAMIQAPAAPIASSMSTSTKKNGWLPLLSILFLISYGLMTMLIVEQGRTIESQRALIHELYRDSAELSATKRASQDRSESQMAPTQAPLTQTPLTQSPLTQSPLTQTPATQTPSSRTPSSQTLSKQSPSTQATTQTPSSQTQSQQQHAQSQSAKQTPEFKMPSKPEPDLVDDVRNSDII